MEPYALIPGAGPFAASVDAFAALVAELEGPGAAGLTACELEDLLAERGREVQRQLLQDHLDLRAVREEQAAREHHAAATGADGITRTRLEAGCWPPFFLSVQSASGVIADERHLRRCGTGRATTP